MFLIRFLKICLPLLLLSACAAALPPLTYNPAVPLETLSAAVSISITSAETGMSASGFLVYRRPDQLHLVVLSPFGTTLMEVFTRGERITLLYPGKSVAYVGTIAELPTSGGLQGWRMMRWIMDAAPSNDQRLSGTLERRAADGSQESVTYQNGLITTKKNGDGDQVYYTAYSAINGIPLASEIDLRSSNNDQIRLLLADPEVNPVLDEAAFLPLLDGLMVLPLSALKGF
jgi:outer membrane biogenesis lipoprotein LolB